MSFLEVERRSKTHSTVSTSVLTHTVLSKGFDEGVLVSFSFAIEGKEGAHSSHVLNPSGVIFSDAVESISHNLSNFDSILLEIVTLDESVLVLSKESTDGISHESVMMTVDLFHLSFIVVIETTCLHFFGEAHEIWRRLKVEVFMGPEFSRCDDSSLNFVNNHVFTHSFGLSANLVHVPARDIDITTFGKDRFNNDCSDFDALLFLVSLNCLFHALQGFKVLLVVVVGILFERILVERSVHLGPVKCGDIHLHDSLGG